jgi:hypothetical protein
VPASRIGAYGSAGLVDWLIQRGRATFGWAVQTWGAVTANINLCQMYSPVPGAPSNLGGSVDPNECLQQDWGQNPAPALAHSTTLEGDLLMSRACTDVVTGGCWVVGDDGGVFAYQGAPMLGNAVGKGWNIGTGTPNPIVGIVAFGTGYSIIAQWGPADFRFYSFPSTRPMPVGAQGPAGKDGATGPAGKDGAPGTPGKDGPPGVGTDNVALSAEVAAISAKLLAAGDTLAAP